LFNYTKILLEAIVSNLDVVAGLKPEKLWKHFAKISEIPRGSGDEAAVMSYLRDFAKEQNLEFKEDKIGNIVIYKDASAGFENYPGVVLQGHTDMVCEKNKDTVHDFTKDPIRLKKDGDFITADGTTLGADNAIGFCAALAVLEDDSVVHGPIEALFTVDEETGMTGAFQLDPAMINSSIMLNMDSEEDGVLYVGCAGGKDTIGVFKKTYSDPDPGKKAFKIVVDGLKGGHSGLDIEKGLANAIQLMVRLLKDLLGSGKLNIVDIEGGSKRNAIPREAEATVLVDMETAAKMDDFTAQWQNAFEDEFGITEPGLKITISPAEFESRILDDSLTLKIVNTLFLAPHGVVAMSQSISGLVETSTNLATVEDRSDEIWIGTSQRSAIASAINDISLRVKSLFETMGAEVKTGKAYPGWKPNLDSKILNVASEAMRKMNGVKPDVKAIHAGLECGIIGEKFAAMDTVSFGPTIMGAHSPDEKVDTVAVEKFWEYLLDILQNIDKAVA